MGLLLDVIPERSAGGLDEVRALVRDRGYAGPIDIFSLRECRLLLSRLRARQERTPLDWAKGWAAASADYFALATDERILDLVTAVLGDDVLLWGASLITRRPGQVHSWHTDTESSASTAEAVSVWIGLAGTDAGSSLRVAPFSHGFGVTVQEMAATRGVSSTAVEDDRAAGWARELDERSGAVTLDLTDGQALVFDGRLWHGSRNVGKQTRYAALLQYASPETRIRIPTYRPGTLLEVHEVPRPPCIVVRGRDVQRVNRTVVGPAARGARGPSLTTRVEHLALPLERDAAVGWKSHGLFRGATPGLPRVGCHVSVLEPGQQPHPPHRHEEEELLVVLDGEAELVLETTGSAGTRTSRGVRGTFAYYPAGFGHTIRNRSARAVTYTMFKWTGDERFKWPGDDGSNGERLGLQIVDTLRTPEADTEGARDGFTPTGVLKGGTRYLERLASHVTTLAPEAGYEAHVDSYDVAIVLLEGTFETLGERVSAPAVVFYAAGEPHGMRNPTTETARYVVFELGARSSVLSARREPSFALRGARALVHPRRTLGHVAQRVHALVRERWRAGIRPRI